MSRLGGAGIFPIRPGGNIYDAIPPPPPIQRRPRPSNLSREERDQGLPASYPYPPTSSQRPLNFSVPPRGGRDHRQSLRFTPWVLNLTSETHKCADLNLFRTPRPQPPASSTSSSNRGGNRGTVSRPGQRGQSSSSRVGRAGRASQPPQPRQNPLRRGTVVLPILPGPKRRMPFFDVSVMTLSNVLYTPGKKYSELSWKVLERQGFTRHVLHDDHTHDVTRRSSRDNARQYIDGASRLRISGGGLTNPQGPPRPGRNSHGGQRFLFDGGRKNSESCGRLDKEASVIRHPAIPGVDLLWCVYDNFMAPGVISVHMTAAAMVDVDAWSWGVENGIVGRSARFNATNGGANGLLPVGWIARYGGNAPDEEPVEGDAEDLFRKIVQGGLFAGEDLVRDMGRLGVREG